MSAKEPLNSDQINLTRRYLIWCYKTTKEELDKVDRYFTQLVIDEFVLEKLHAAKDKTGNVSKLSCQKKIDEFSKYMSVKQANVLEKKFIDGKSGELQPEYWYLQERLKALESAVVQFLGKSELSKIKKLYEEEMTRRILEARDH